MNRLRKSFDLLRKVSFKKSRFQLFNTTSKTKGGHGGGGAQSEASHGNKSRQELFEERGYAYREIVNLEGKIPTRFAEVLHTFVWFYIFYGFWTKSDDYFGHMPYPDPAKWTDEELGIPPDDE